ncbi:MAG: hypothetical protein QOJ54_1024 [Aliidongia sp.]|nr:hypothetical protein [Aliidongia sp.]
MSDQPTVCDPGPRPELAWLPVAMLSIDPGYQRTIEGRVSQAAIAKIARNFQWSCFGVAMVAQQRYGGDGWAIIDGQHRVEAARRVGLKTVPCIVVVADDPRHQAAIFLATNETRVKVNPYAIHHAKLAAGDEAACATSQLAHQAGIEIPRFPIQRNHLAPGQTLALATITQATEDRHGTKAVMLVGAAWANKPGGISALVIRATWEALKQGVPEDAVRRWLERQDEMGAGKLTSHNIGEIVLRMRRSASLGCHAVAGIDRARLMAGR